MNFQRRKVHKILPAVTADILRILININDHPDIILINPETGYGSGLLFNDFRVTDTDKCINKIFVEIIVNAALSVTSALS